MLVNPRDWWILFKFFWEVVRREHRTGESAEQIRDHVNLQIKQGKRPELKKVLDKI